MCAADLVGLIGGGLHLLVDPTLQLIRVPEELLEVEGVVQSGPPGLSSLMQGIPATQQLQINRNLIFNVYL